MDRTFFIHDPPQHPLHQCSFNQLFCMFCLGSTDRRAKVRGGSRVLLIKVYVYLNPPLFPPGWRQRKKIRATQKHSTHLSFSISSRLPSVTAMGGLLSYLSVANYYTPSRSMTVSVVLYFSNFLCFFCFCHPIRVPFIAPLSALTFPPLFSDRPCPGSSVSGHDESPGDHAATDAADPPAAGALPPAAPGPAPTAAGRDAAAGTDTRTQC